MTNKTTTLTISGNGTLPYVGGYHLDCLVHVDHTEYTTAYRWSCPFEGQEDGAFSNCSKQLPLHQIATLVPLG